MSRWKDRGYVPDSEGDDDDEILVSRDVHDGGEEGGQTDFTDDEIEIQRAASQELDFGGFGATRVDHDQGDAPWTNENEATAHHPEWSRKGQNISYESKHGYDAALGGPDEGYNFISFADALESARAGSGTSHETAPLPDDERAHNPHSPPSVAVIIKPAEDANRITAAKAERSKNASSPRHEAACHYHISDDDGVLPHTMHPGKHIKTYGKRSQATMQSQSIRPADKDTVATAIPMDIDSAPPSPAEQPHPDPMDTGSSRASSQIGIHSRLFKSTPEYEARNGTTPLTDQQNETSDSELSDVDEQLLLSTSQQHRVGHAPSSHRRLSLDPLAAPVRSFRPRKAVQLHPYLLEDQQYRQALKAVGYNPVRVATSEHRPKAAAHGDSVDREFIQDSSQISQDSPPLPPSSPPRADPLPASQLPALLQFPGSDDEDYPDGAATERRSISGGLQQGYKRLKINDTPTHHGSASSGPKAKLKSVRAGKERRRVGSIGKESTTASPAVLPPANPCILQHPDIPKFRRPPGLPPVVNAAATTSTTGRNITTPVVPPQVISDLESSESERSNPVPPSNRRRLFANRTPGSRNNDDAESAASDQHSSPDSDAERRQILRFRKRIKGVLPASYLKLDHITRKQTSTAAPPPPPSHRRPSPPPTRPLKGVAQHKTPSTSTTLTRRATSIIISDDSEQSEDASTTRLAPSAGRASPRPLPQRHLKPFDDTGEVEEHDEIDRMLPSGSISRFKKGSGTKRQSTLTDGFVEHGEGRVQGRQHRTSAAAKRGAPPSKAPKRTKQSKPRKRAPQLGLLDALHQQTSPTRPPPQFLRVAARRARQMPNQGRHSPTHKTIRLATREDTEDALAPLRTWRTGAMQQTWRAPVNAQDAASDAPIDKTLAARRAASVNTSRASPRTLTNPRHDGQPRSRGDAVQRTRRPAQPRTNPAFGRDPPHFAHRPAQGTLERPSRMFPAQLEAIALGPYTRVPDMLTFAPQPSRLMEIVRQGESHGSASRFRLERFLQDQSRMAGPISDDAVMAEPANPQDTSAASRKPRKRLARRIDTELVRYRQPNEPLPVSSPSEELSATVPKQAEHTLQGLGSIGTTYATDFDVRPLALGTFFNQSTFVGSGDFADCLVLRGRDLDVSAGTQAIRVNDKILQWSEWTEDVSTGLDEISSSSRRGLQAVLNAATDEQRESTLGEVQTSINYFLRSLVRYCSECLCFMDVIDRSQCLSRFSRFLDDFVDMLGEYVSKIQEMAHVNSQVRRLHIDALLYLLCISAQITLVGGHPSVDEKSAAELLARTIRLGRAAFTDALPGRFTALRSFLEDHRRHTKRDLGIQEEDVAVKTVVVVHHVLRTVHSPVGIADIMAEKLMSAAKASSNVQALDQVWYDCFTLQPLLEIDVHGIYRPGNRLQIANDSWTLVKALLETVFSLYPASIHNQNPTLNDYVRACMIRVYHLITRWGWRKCESVLNTIFDFFAGIKFAQLMKEKDRGSPRFLDKLDRDLAAHVDVNDDAFHVFLKLVVVGLRGMQSVYPPNKIRCLAWRLIPNHGRTYRKDQGLQETDLSALRNHHDLLCTLYWVLPPGKGPRLQVLKDLVDHSISHSAACRLNVHAWGIIARYQMSQEEPFPDLDQLATWFREMITTNIAQYRLARSEAEATFTAETARGNTSLTPETVESLIRENQSTVSTILLDLLHAMLSVIQAAKSWPLARRLAETSCFVEVLKLYDTGQARLNTVVLSALDTVNELLSKAPLPATKADSQQASEESQEYGDWSHLDEIAEDVPMLDVSDENSTGFIHRPLAHLLSTCFGSDKCPDDKLLVKLTGTWVRLAHAQIKESVREWKQYIDVCGSNSWFQLRDTEHRHKYTPHFLSLAIDADRLSLDDEHHTVLGAWLVSLMDRESMLKFQHQLTASLLNAIPDDPLLHNLPFVSTGHNRRVDISLAILRERRISLLGSVFYNMRSSVEDNFINHPGRAQVLRREYADMLRQAQLFMRRNYEELQAAQRATSNAPQATVSGVYVSFVHHVIALMQQYTTDICSVDPFFIDSSMFPLPHHDPTYVVGRLKSYASKLHDSRGRKQLAMFLQTLSERAAVDNQQAYLTSQLVEAMAGHDAGFLRRFILTSLFPAYLDAAATHPCAWIVALPLINAAGLVLADMLYDINLRSPSEGPNDLAAIVAVLAALHSCAHRLASDRAVLSDDPHILHLLTAVYRAATAALTTAEWARHGVDTEELAAQFLRALDAEARILLSSLSRATDDDGVLLSALVPALPLAPPPTTPHYADTYAFAKRALNEDLQRSWRADGHGGYAVVRAGGGGVRAVVVQVGALEEETERLRETVQRFREEYKVVFGTRRAAAAAGIDTGFGLGEVAGDGRGRSAGMGGLIFI